MKTIKSTAAQSLLFMITAYELIGRGEGVEVLNPSPVMLSSFNFFPSPTHHLDRRNVEESESSSLLLVVAMFWFLCVVTVSIYWASDDDDSEAENAQNDDSSTEVSALSSSSTQVDSECAYLTLGDSDSSDVDPDDDGSQCVYLKVDLDRLNHSDSSDSSFADFSSYDATEAFDAVIDIPNAAPGEIISVEEIVSDDDQRANTMQC